MSLNRRQKEQTSEDLKANFEHAGLTAEQVCDGLGFDAHELARVLDMAPGVNPTSVWRLKDYLDDQIRAQGKEPLPYAVLKVNIWYQY